MMSNTEKKVREKTVLLDALSLARRRGGESRRNCDRLQGLVEEYERPDFILHLSPSANHHKGAIVGIEHFRVDDLIKGRRARSVASEERAMLSKTRKKWRAEVAETGRVPDEAIAALVDPIQRLAKAKMQSSPLSLEHSFFERVSGENGHLSKTFYYEENLKKFACCGQQIELGFLVEVHSDCDGLFIWEAGRGRKGEKGQFCITEGILRELEMLAKQVKWLILAVFDSTSEVIRDAFVCRAVNGSFKQSLNRQGLRLHTYIGGLNDFFRDANLKCSLETKAEEAVLCFEREYAEWDNGTIMSHVFEDCSIALRCKRDGWPYIVHASSQMMVHVVWDELPQSNKRAISKEDVENCFFAMPREERLAKAQAFGEMWKLEEARQ